MDQRLGYLVKLFNVSQDQGVLADQVDDARYTAACPVNCCNRIIGEDAFRGSGNQQALGDIVGGLFRRDRMRTRPEGDPLTQLADIGSAQLLFELGLA